MIIVSLSIVEGPGPLYYLNLKIRKIVYPLTLFHLPCKPFAVTSNIAFALTSYC